MSFSSASLILNLSAVLSNTVGSYSPAILKQLTLVAGITDGACDLCYAAERTITNSGTPDVMDLIGGGLLTPEGAAFNPVKLSTICIVNSSAAQVLAVGAGTAPLVGWLGGTTPTKTVGKSGILLDHNPLGSYTVTTTTADKLQVATDGGSNILYLVFLLGRSA